MERHDEVRNIFHPKSMENFEDKKKRPASVRKYIVDPS